MDDFDAFDGQIEALEGSLGDAAAMVAGFDGALRRMQQSLSATGQDAASLEKSMNRGLRKTFDGLVFDGAKLSDALSNLVHSLVTICDWRKYDETFEELMRVVHQQLEADDITLPCVQPFHAFVFPFTLDLLQPSTGT